VKSDPRQEDFPYDGCPTYDGPRPEGAEAPDPDCCNAPDCPQRDYNRATILALETLSRAYASLHLLRSAASRLWNCDSDGHTIDCPDPACRFGTEMAVNLDRVRSHHAQVVRDLFRVLTVPAFDVRGSWQEFVDTESARLMIESLAKAVAVGEVEDYAAATRTVKRFIAVWQRQAVGDDPIEMVRWFQPPAGDDAPPN
jgi:hypothetical protein